MNKQIIEIGFSPCPNDTFIFDALVNQKINTGNLEFIPVLEDVQTLNQWALADKLAITKLSFGVLPAVLDNYNLLNSGAALGQGSGPLLIAKHPTENDSVNQYQIAIPGENTTANLLFSLAYPKAKNKVYLRYDEIEKFVLDANGLGVIIHENRFTYAERGLHKVADLSDVWEQTTNLPVPLGGIVIKRSIPLQIQQQVQHLIRQSLEFAYANNQTLPAFVKENAQEMSEEVMRKHIDLYVNDYSLNLGPVGRAAVSKLIEVWRTANPQATTPRNDFFISEPAAPK